jgi:predicted glycogen debranching enzyme
MIFVTQKLLLKTFYMLLQKGKSDLQKEIEILTQPNDILFYEGSEWLETNGLGGWAGSMIIGCNTRRYHGLLVAATKPPTERMVLLSKLDETVVSSNKRLQLGTNLYSDDVIHPNGYQYLSSFTKELFPEWLYETDGLKLKKTITMVHDENTTLILYELIHANEPITLELLPLIAARGYHSLQHSYNNIFWDVQFENGIFKNQPYEDAPTIFISVPNASYQHHPSWFYKFNYAVEKYRGLDFEEDLFNHGTISIELKEGEELGIIISTEDPFGKNAHALFENEKQRKLRLISRLDDQSPNLSIIDQLTLAADQFIVRRDEDLKTIIAGYHWFTDWGRDTMISLPGLCLATGRYEDAKKIIAAFAKNVSMGMLPNRFQDSDQPPEYNNVDGTLWYFIAVHKFLQHTNDAAFIISEILPVLKHIIDWHFKGTRYNIHVDRDGLLYAGEKGQQLTWMDARIGDWVVTPRMGKPVEIQALWYNALKIFAALLELNDQLQDAALVNLNAEKVKQSFLEKFWYAHGNYLYDVIDENGNPDASLRPNQLFAVSLPFTLIDKEQAIAVLKIIDEKLYTPVGLRSLPQDDERYVSVYGGDAFKRDSCYHQGTIWGWLLGPYINALMSAPGFTGPDRSSGKKKAQKIIADFIYHLNEGCIGSVSEIFDADAPHYPRGCIAQAWSVGEILRVIKENDLEVV